MTLPLLGSGPGSKTSGGGGGGGGSATARSASLMSAFGPVIVNTSTTQRDGNVADIAINSR